MSASASTIKTQIEYIPLVVEALRELGGVGKAASVKSWIAKKFPSEVNDSVLPSGASKFTNDIQWARMYLVNAGILEPMEKSGRGIWKLTPAGWEIALNSQVAQSIYDASAKKGKAVGSDTQDAPEADDKQGELASTKTWELDLRKLLPSIPHEGFERLCAFIMASNKMEARATGKTGDGGVDGEGLLPVDGFGLVKMRVAWQCKRFEKGSVGSKDIRDFRGAIDGRANYGLFFTTSTFTKEAIKESERPGATPIELIDLHTLIKLMGEQMIGIQNSPDDPSNRETNHEFFVEYLHPKGTADSTQPELPISLMT